MPNCLLLLTAGTRYSLLSLKLTNNIVRIIGFAFFFSFLLLILSHLRLVNHSHKFFVFFKRKSNRDKKKYCKISFLRSQVSRKKREITNKISFFFLCEFWCSFAKQITYKFHFGQVIC